MNVAVVHKPQPILKVPPGRVQKKEPHTLPRGKPGFAAAA